jgi:hypothetical protein
MVGYQIFSTPSCLSQRLLSLVHEAIPDLDCSSYAIRMDNQLCITSFLRPWESLFLDVIADTSRTFVGVLVKSLWAYSDTESVRSWFALPANLSNGPGESIELQGLCSKIFLAARQVYCMPLVLRLSPRVQMSFLVRPVLLPPPAAFSAHPLSCAVSTDLRSWHDPSRLWPAWRSCLSWERDSCLPARLNFWYLLTTGEDRNYLHPHRRPRQHSCLWIRWIPEFRPSCLIRSVVGVACIHISISFHQNSPLRRRCQGFSFSGGSLHLQQWAGESLQSEVLTVHISRNQPWRAF